MVVVETLLYTPQHVCGWVTFDFISGFSERIGHWAAGETRGIGILDFIGGDMLWAVCFDVEARVGVGVAVGSWCAGRE